MVSVALSNIHTGQVGHDESPQLLVCSKLRRKHLKKVKFSVTSGRKSRIICIKMIN